MQSCLILTCLYHERETRPVRTKRIVIKLKVLKLSCKVPCYSAWLDLYFKKSSGNNTIAFIYDKKKVNQTHRVFKYLHVNVISLAIFASTKYLCNFTGTVAQCQRQVGYEGCSYCLDLLPCGKIQAIHNNNKNNKVMTFSIFAKIM